MTMSGLSKTLRAGLFAASAAAALTYAAAAGAAPTPVPSSQTVAFSVYLPLQNTAAMKTLLTQLNTKGSPNYRKWLTQSQINAQFAPSAATMTSVEAALTNAGLTITATHPFSIDVSGTAAQVNKALGVVVKSLPSSTGGTRLVTTSRLVLPTALAAASAVIPSFAPVPEHSVQSLKVPKAAPKSRLGPYGGYFYDDLKEAYDYPAYPTKGAPGLDGTGVNVAIVMSSDATTADIANMFANENFLATTGLTIYPTYTTLHIGADPGINNAEPFIDTQEVLGGAPGANVTLVTTPDLTDNSIINAYTYIVLSNSYDIVSSSFGECEIFYTPDYNNGYDYTNTLALYDEIFSYGSLEGISFVASSGDSAGLQCTTNNYIGNSPIFVPPPNTAHPKFILGVETPAADPNVTAVGGGNLQTSYVAGSLTSTYLSENDYGDPEIPYDPYGLGLNVSGGYWGGGGGISQIFAQPPYQTTAYTGASTRTVPDVGFQVGGCPGGITQGACPSNRSYGVFFIFGTPEGYIGTSLSAPQFAGALALAEQYYGGRFGNVNYGLYALGAAQIAAGGANAPPADQFFHQNIAGYDGHYTQTPNGGYNYINGNGTPDVRILFNLTSLPAAGDPQTASNP